MFPRGFVSFLVSRTSRACDLCPEGMHRQAMESYTWPFGIYTPESHDSLLRSTTDSIF